MRVKINLSNLVIPFENLKHLDALLDGASLWDYDYNNGKSVHYCKPMASDSLPTVTLMPDDVYETYCLVWKLKEEAKNGV